MSAEEAPEVTTEVQIVDEIVLDAAQRYGLDIAVDAMKEAQERVRILSNAIVAGAGWPDGTRFTYEDGKLIQRQE